MVLDDKTFVLISEKPVIDEHRKNMPINEIPDALDVLEQARFEADVIIQDAEREANEKIKNAHKSSESIVSDAYDNAKEIMTSAKNEGYQDGFNQGYEEGKYEASKLIDEANNIKSQWMAERENLLLESEQQMIQLVIDSLEEMIGYKLENDATLIEALIRKGISRITKTENLILRVSTEDYNQAVSVKPMIQSMCDKVSEIDIRRDASLPNGSCIIDGDSGTVDSGIWTQFEQVRKMFLNMLQGDANVD